VTDCSCNTLLEGGRRGLAILGESLSQWVFSPLSGSSPISVGVGQQGVVTALYLSCVGAVLVRELIPPIKLHNRTVQSSSRRLRYIELHGWAGLPGVASRV